jgi:signal transduction histidine kinase
MRFRVEAEGGSLTLQSAPGHGTLIRVSLPAATPVCT